ncbi:pyroglutamyl-peptidase I [Paenibacillus guangzhouensis]|uniref:pyroglutamyl-peptidase I n=1 Tax=Paenibacillus guangzhouensis TaxID=1473112 RepID=UPI001266EB7C|nr:pyroglutamyl-peptidase I [Paenibacillus guangzhouensis]
MKNILLTGFEPFGGETMNPSWEAVKCLDGEILFGDYQIQSVQLPTVFGDAIHQLAQAQARISPVLTLCIGQAGGSSELRVERIAINLDDARIPDNAGNQPIDQPIVPDGPTAYWSTLPIKSIVEVLKENGIPASVSHSAGTYVCNHLFYGLMHRIAESKVEGKGGFIHIPFLPEQVASNRNQPSMSLETIVRGIRIATEVSLRQHEDIRVVGGALD